MRNAIIAKTFKQDRWDYLSGGSGGTLTEPFYKCYYYSTSHKYRIKLENGSYGDSITRNCYLLSVSDIIDYLGATVEMDFSNTVINDINIWGMFWNRTTSPGSDSKYNLWLRSACYDSFPRNTVIVDGGLGMFYNDEIGGHKYAVRPAFQIDLSKIEWTKQ